MRNLPRASHWGLCLSTSDNSKDFMLDFASGLMACAVMSQGKAGCVSSMSHVHISQERIWGWPLPMCLGAVKPHGYSFGFHVGSKIYRVLKQKVLYVQKLWKSLLTHGINRKHVCPKLSWTELFFLTGFAELLPGSAGSKALTNFFRNTWKSKGSLTFFSISSKFSALPGKTFIFSKRSIY